jgi:hypothetical protein
MRHNNNNNFSYHQQYQQQNQNWYTALQQQQQNNFSQDYYPQHASNQQFHNGGYARNFQRPETMFPNPRMNFQRNQKRAHERSPNIAIVQPTSSSRNNQGETSPSPKRQNFVFNNQPQQQQKFQQPKRISPAESIQNFKEKEWNELFNQTLSLLQSSKPGDEINVLLTYLQPSRATCERTQKQITDDLKQILQPLGIDRVYVFGSSLTGLDFIGSDIDFHVQVKTPPTNEDERKQVINKAAKQTRYFHGHGFRIIYTIQHARVPLIRLLHTPTNTTCDVNNC